MALVASRQAGSRPQTIRTHLARFLPNRAASGWSISWSARTERPDDIGHPDELRAADHLGCFGAAVAHALAQAHVSAVSLGVTAVAEPPVDGTPQPIAVEVRATIPGIPFDQSILETVLRHVEPACPVWRSLAAEVGLQVTGVLEDPDATPALCSRAEAAPLARTTSASPSTGRPWSLLAGLRRSAPGWVTPRIATYMALAVGAVAVVPHLLPGA